MHTKNLFQPLKRDRPEYSNVCIVDGMFMKAIVKTIEQWTKWRKLD